MSDPKKSPRATSGNQTDLSREKKAEVLGRSDKKKTVGTLIILLIVAVAGAVGIAAWQLTGGDSRSPSSSSSAGYKPEGSTITIEAAQFDDGKARHFAYPLSDGVNVRFFILKSSDGVIRAAFDACDVCWKAGKGYAQEGDGMVCLNCGRRFPSMKINEVKGGCNPAPLRRVVKDGKVLIEVADIAQGRQYFNF